MKIAESVIQLTSSHAAVEYSERRESLTVWQQGREPGRAEEENANEARLQARATAAAEQAARVSLSQEGVRRAASPVPEQSEVGGLSEEDRLLSDLNLRILKAIFERLTGRTIKMLDPDAITAQESAQATAQSPPEQAPAAQEGQPLQGWGVRYERHEIHHEAESTQFAARGLVTTADGQEIEIAVDLHMSRSFTSESHELFLAGDALKDPLAINFAGTAAQLTQDKFSFDIDADGSDDQISFAAPGSGFLALDANEDGVVNNGAELFGALSGDGFADLAAHDDDGNGWIDENDAVFSRLRIWARDAAGQDKMLTLLESNVGALYLGRVETPFAIKDSGNELQGQVRATGLFLREDGGAGTMQQVDLVA